jgi:hypothetical protein
VNVGTVYFKIGPTDATATLDGVTGLWTVQPSFRSSALIQRVLRSRYDPVHYNDSPSKGVWGRQAVVDAAKSLDGRVEFPVGHTAMQEMISGTEAGAAKADKCGGPGSGVPGPCPQNNPSPPTADQHAPVAVGRPICERIAADSVSKELMDKALADSAEAHARHQELDAKAKASDQKSMAANRALKEKPPDDVQADKAKLEAWKATRRQASRDAADQYSKDRMAASKAHREANEKASATLKTDEPASLTVTNVGHYDNAKTIAQREADWVGSMLHDPDGAHRGIDLTVSSSGRAFAKDGEKATIGIPRIATDTQAVHEIGHTVEYKVPGVHKACLAFLDHRCGNEVPSKIGPDHDADEVGRKDDFTKAVGSEARARYVGKVYKSGWTEVMSMGLEEMRRDAVGFMHRDPEYARFLIGVMHGRLR